MKLQLSSLLFVLFSVLALPGYTQVVTKESTTIEAYYGYPDVYNLVYRSALGSQGVYNVSTRSQGPVGMRLDHILTRRIGLGLDLWYVNTKITGVYNPNNTATTVNNVTFNANLLRLNAIIRLTIHLAKHQKFDPYVHAGVGYSYSRFRFESSNRGIFNKDNPLLPIAARVGMGLKYYFNPETGMMVDVGLGGPFITIGFFKRWLKKDETN